MPTYRARFKTTISVVVTVNADDEETAADVAWVMAEKYLETVTGNHEDVTADASLDGIGADTVEDISPALAAWMPRPDAAPVARPAGEDPF